jgi:hypothetical protein
MRLLCMYIVVAMVVDLFNEQFDNYDRRVCTQWRQGHLAILRISVVDCNGDSDNSPLCDFNAGHCLFQEICSVISAPSMNSEPFSNSPSHHIRSALRQCRDKLDTVSRTCHMSVPSLYVSDSRLIVMNS